MNFFKLSKSRSPNHFFWTGFAFLPTYKKKLGQQKIRADGQASGGTKSSQTKHENKMTESLFMSDVLFS